MNTADVKALFDRVVSAAAACRVSGTGAVTNISWVTERAENLVSHHLRALRTAGLVTSRRDGKMVMYSVTDAGRALLAAVLADAEPVR
jgi:DNA-binding transcriptional ArsR family regulator